MVNQRVAGQPIEHVLGWAEFHGLRIAVAPGVFVPRRRTEFLVGQAIAVARPGDVVVDLCCGAGAIGIALAAAVPRSELHAADIDPAAVRCARRNAAAYAATLGFTAHVYQGDLYQPLPSELRGRVAVLTANVPYVPTEEIAFLPPEARTYEPQVALDGGGDGLDLLRRVAAAAPGWLAPGGHLFVETSERQAEAARTAFAAGGLKSRVISDEDLAATVITGQRPG